MLAHCKHNFVLGFKFVLCVISCLTFCLATHKATTYVLLSLTYGRNHVHGDRQKETSQTVIIDPGVYFQMCAAVLSCFLYYGRVTSKCTLKFLARSFDVLYGTQIFVKINDISMSIIADQIPGGSYVERQYILVIEACLFPCTCHHQIPLESNMENSILTCVS